jgi:predicted DNA-binding protein (UPF0251 family)
MDDTHPTGDRPSVTELTFTTTDDSYPLVALTTQLDATVTILDWTQSTTGTCPTSWFVCVSSADPDSALEVLRGGERTESVALLDHRADESLVEMTVTDSVARTVGDAGALLWRVGAADGEGTATVLVPPVADAETVAEHVHREHPSLDLTSIVTHPVTRTFLTRRSFQHSLEDELTERQWEALRLAYEGGYFERPREATQSGVATEMGISQETVSQHLRAAQRRLLQVVFDEGLLHGGDSETAE